MLRLDILQHRALRIILGTSIRASVPAMHVEYDLEPLAFRRIKMVARQGCVLTRKSSANDLVAKMWMDWDSLSRFSDIDFPADPHAALGSGRVTTSPFDIIKVVSDHLRLSRDDLGGEQTRLFRYDPVWTNQQLTSDHLDDAPVVWPHVGGASSRTDQQKLDATCFGRAQITKYDAVIAQSQQIGWIAFTDIRLCFCGCTWWRWKWCGFYNI